MDAELDRIVFTKTHGDIQTQLKICVVPDEDAEIRQLSLTNLGNSLCMLEVTSYLEPVLARKDAFQAHPAFNKLFIETEVDLEAGALLAHRRTGKPNPSPWLVHALHVDVPTFGPLEFETDRSRFVGRGRSYRIPVVIETNQRLSGTTGAVLDPVFALRRRVQLNPGETANFTFITGVAPTREEALALVDRLATPYSFEQACELAYNRAQLELQEMKIPLHQVSLLQQLASQLFYYNYYQRTRSSVLPKNVKDQSALWAYGISGDLPLILLWLEDENGTVLAERLLRYHQYWKRKGLITDLVILINNEEGYRQTLFEAVQRIIYAFPEPEGFEQPGGVFLFAAPTIPREDQILLEMVARIVLRSDGGSIRSQLRPVLDRRRTLPEPLLVQLPAPVEANYIPTEPPEELLFFNGWGGFTPDGKEYVIQLRTKDLLPTPWSNVIANPRFGFTVSESGGGYTWAANSREYKLTPWSNDPVLDPSGEICYLRDEKTGLLWSLTALPIRDTEPYTVRHGQGYTVFEHHSQGINQTGLVFTPIDAPVKILRLTLQNTEDREREIAVTHYLEWTLGVNREKTPPLSSPNTTATAGRCWRGMSTRKTSGTSTPFLASGPAVRSSTAAGPGTGRSLLAATAVCPSRRPSSGSACRTRREPGITPAGRCKSRFTCRLTGNGPSIFWLVRLPPKNRSENTCGSTDGVPASKPPTKPSENSGPICWAGCKWPPRTGPSISSSTTGCSTRRLAAVYGPAAPFTSPEGLMVTGISSRTSWPYSMPGPGSPADRSYSMPPTSI